MKNLEEKVLPIIKNTRSITLPHFGKAEVLVRKSESAHDVVTELDQKVETYLKNELQKIYPDVGFVGEEFGGSRMVKKFWLVDPIDGTGLYLRGIPFCTTMLALVEDGEVIFGVIYDFVNDIVYHAEKGKGAYKNGTRIQVSDKEIKNSYIAWETHWDKSENMKKVVELRKISTLFKSLCNGYEYALIAEGKLEGKVVFDPYGGDYDFAAGTLLVAEAGGIVRNIGSEGYDYRNLNFIASNPAVHAELQNIFKDYKMTGSR